MADIAITAANVIKGTGATTAWGIAGVAITAGQTVYQEASTNLIKLCDALFAAGAKATCVGVALNNAAVNQPVQYQTGGQITIGGTVVAGAPYFASANNAGGGNAVGGVCDVTQLAAGWFTMFLGLAISTTVISLQLQNPVVAHG